MRTRTKVGIAAAVVVAAGIGGGVWWFYRDDAPPPVSLERAVEALDDSATTTPVTEPEETTGSTTETSTEPAAGSTSIAGAEPAAGVTGDWIVDTTSGDFDYESATGTFVGFRIEEELASIGSTTAVGRTGEVTGSISIDGTTLTDASFEVDMTTITTNEERRDDQVQRALEVGEQPTASFVLTNPIDLGAAAADGEAITVTAAGDLTIHGVTRSVELPIEAQLVNGTIVVVGSLDITFSDYDVEVPDSQIVVSVEDHGILELQMLFVAV